MVRIPFKAMAVVAVVAAYVGSTRQQPWSLLRFVGILAGTWLLEGLLMLVYAVILWPSFLSPLRNLPQPERKSWFMGQFARIAADPSGIPMRDWAINIPHNGLIRYLGLLNQERVLVLSPKALAEVLVTKNYDFQKPAQLRNAIGRILGVGILLAEGDEHKAQRRSLMPAFAFRHIKNLYSVFWDKAREGVTAMTEEIQAAIEEGHAGALEGEETAAKAKPKTNGEANGHGQTVAADVEKQSGAEQTKKDYAVVEVGYWASRITLDIIGVAGMGRDFGAIHDPHNELTLTYQTIFKPSKEAQRLGMLGLFLPAWIVNRLPVKRNDDIQGAMRLIRAVCLDLIREKKEKLAKKQLTDPDILSVAIESGGFSDEALVNQLMTFLAAGHETTASAMTWAVYMLCLHPDVQQRLRAEVRARLPSPDDAGAASVSSVDIDHMPYLNAFVSELLRYYSPVPLTVREAAVDTSIQGQPVPRGTRVIIAPWATNYDPELWGPDADKFDPDRWLAPEGASEKERAAAAAGGATSNFALLTFLHGPRSCIGSAFARAEFACLISSWVGRFSFEIDDPELHDESKVLIKGGITARPAKGLYVRMKPLEGW